jgi:hypothetical protein
VNGQVFFLIAGVFVHVLSTNYQFEGREEAGATTICVLVLSKIDDVLSSVNAHYKPHYGVERK